jgi:hypothetical protein
MNGLSLSALRLALRSYRDLYERIWVMLLVTTVWWVLLVTVVFAPPATLLLFRHADPRIGSWQDRPDIRESGQFLWSNLVRSWLITLVTIPVVALTAFNLDYYGTGNGPLAFISPLWFVLLLLTITAAFVIFALAGVTDLSPKEAIFAGARVTGARLPGALVLLLFTVIIPLLVIMATYYVLLPLAFAIPPLVATAFSTFVLRATGTPLPEPNKPTEERLHEKRSG